MESTTTTTKEATEATAAQKKGSKGNVYKVELSKFPGTVQEIEGFNRRKDYGDIDELAKSIAENGVRVPTSGYYKDGIWYVRNGNRRLAASLIAIEKYGAEVIFPIIADPQNFTETDALIDMIAHNSGKPFTMLEEATVVGDLRALGLADTDIAKKTGKTIVAVRNLLNLLEATPEVKDQIQAGAVAASTVIEMQRENNPETVGERINDAIATTGKKKVTAKDIEGAKSGRERVAKSKDPDVERERQAGLPAVEPKAETNGATKEAPVKKGKEHVLQITQLKGLMEEAIKADAKEWNMFSRRILILLENYAKGAVNFEEVLSAFVDGDATV